MPKMCTPPPYQKSAACADKAATTRYKHQFYRFHIRKFSKITKGSRMGRPGIPVGSRTLIERTGIFYSIH